MFGFLSMITFIVIIFRLIYVYDSIYNIINRDKIERAHYLKLLDEKLKK